jgi:hypothetical protein
MAVLLSHEPADAGPGRREPDPEHPEEVDGVGEVEVGVLAVARTDQVADDLKHSWTPGV